MSYCKGLLIVLCLAALGCGQDPARSVKIATDSHPAQTDPTREGAPAKPPAAAQTAHVPPGVTVTVRVESSRQEPRLQNSPDWVAEHCPAPADDAPAPGGFTVTGPCALRQKEPVSCQALRDDFIAAFTRKGAKGSTFVAYVNVENYTGPGSYDGTQVFLALQSESSIFRWSNDNAHVTVGKGGAFLDFAESRLDAEPMLSTCSRLIGPESNYQYQCQNRSSVAQQVAAEVLSGRLGCRTQPDK